MLAIDRHGSTLTKDERKKIIWVDSKKVFKFGGGTKAKHSSINREKCRYPN